MGPPRTPPTCSPAMAKDRQLIARKCSLMTTAGRLRIGVRAWSSAARAWPRGAQPAAAAALAAAGGGAAAARRRRDPSSPTIQSCMLCMMWMMIPLQSVHAPLAS